ncbi:hypothetical protein EAI_11355 [Harpegnathos saltator]|uniref:Uncharacterized protein n=1 Tax=Harpegnathos saltator TaxID=610380 RepID=E2C6E9_HARSA|nr:hypothetical protein EAI_11355 [Harpegnathos saltator]
MGQLPKLGELPARSPSLCTRPEGPVSEPAKPEAVPVRPMLQLWTCRPSRRPCGPRGPMRRDSGTLKGLVSKLNGGKPWPLWPEKSCGARVGTGLQKGWTPGAGCPCPYVVRPEEGSLSCGTVLREICSTGLRATGWVWRRLLGDGIGPDPAYLGLRI